MVDTILLVSDIAKKYLSNDDILSNGFNVVYADKNSYTKLITGSEYVIAGMETYTMELLSKAENLKMISRCGHGTDNIAKNVVPVTDCRGCLDRSIAEVVIGYIIISCRHLMVIDSNCRKGNWNTPMGRQLSGLTVGIIGYGGIGQEVAKLLSVFDVNVLHYDIIKDRCNCCLKKLVQVSDVITVHCDLNPSSIHLINADIIKQMKDDVIFINTSRGQVVNEDDLVRYHKKFGMIVLDVFDEEPLVLDSPLLSCSNIVFGTHSAGVTQYGYECLAKKSLDNIINERDKN